MRYKVYYEDEDKYFDNIDDVIEWCIESDYHEDDDYFKEWVNDNYRDYEIAGYEYTPYEIINAMNDGCYHDLLRDFCNSMNESDEDNARYELERADAGDAVDIQRWTVCVENDIGDTDGDDIVNPLAGYDALADLRRRLIELQEVNEHFNEESKKEENDLLQIIGG